MDGTLKHGDISGSPEHVSATWQFSKSSGVPLVCLSNNKERPTSDVYGTHVLG